MPAILILQKLAGMFINKKRVIGWISAVAIAGGAIAAGISTQEFKDAACGAPLLEPIAEKK